MALNLILLIEKIKKAEHFDSAADNAGFLLEPYPRF